MNLLKLLALLLMVTSTWADDAVEIRVLPLKLQPQVETILRALNERDYAALSDIFRGAVTDQLEKGMLPRISAAGKSYDGGFEIGSYEHSRREGLDHYTLTIAPVNKYDPTGFQINWTWIGPSPQEIRLHGAGIVGPEKKR